jgi:hypothetical protein
MAITTNAICNSFKEELLEGVHDFTPTTGDVFKLALYTNSATIGADTTAYPGDSTGGQVSNSGQYTQGGGTLVNALVSVNGTTAFVDFNDLSFTGVTLTARGALIYNDSAAGDPAVAVLDFGGDKTATAGTFTIQFPNDNNTQAIIRIS